MTLLSSWSEVEDKVAISQPLTLTPTNLDRWTDGLSKISHTARLHHEGTL